MRTLSRCINPAEEIAPPQIGELESHNSDLLRHTVECEGHCHQLREQAMQFDARWRIMAAENERMEREAGSLRVRLQVRCLPGPQGLVENLERSAWSVGQAGNIWFLQADLCGYLQAGNTCNCRQIELPAGLNLEAQPSCAGLDGAGGGRQCVRGAHSCAGKAHGVRRAQRRRRAGAAAAARAARGAAAQRAAGAVARAQRLCGAGGRPLVLGHEV